ncbi:MAG TPA: ABC transporter permease [Cyclobacteriaceae bacterium]
MFRSYIVVGFRNAIRHRLNSTINIVGLSLALGVAITTFIFIDNQTHADQFHANIHRIYQVTNRTQAGDKLEDWGDSPIMLGPALIQDQSAIESATRIEFADVALRYNETVFTEFVWFVDPAFMTIFSFPTLKGNPQALKNQTEIILSKQIAEKYFGKTDPIGQSISIKFDDTRKEEFTVGAVIERPTGSSLYPEVLLSMEKFENLRFKDSYDWSHLTDATFILLKPSHSITELGDAMDNYKKLQNSVSPQWLIEDFQFHPLKGLVLKGHEIISSVSNGAHPAGLIALSVVSALLLLLASFNYMNVSIATVATRLKEIGIRKVVGGRKVELINQFLMENFLLCTFSMALGLLLSYVFFLPGFNSLYPVSLPFEFSSSSSAILFFGGLLLFIGFVSGAYPSFYISSFMPIDIMRGRQKFGQRSLLSRMLLTFQFILAFTTIVGSFVFIDNSLYLKNKDWGYDQSQILSVPVGDNEKYLLLRDQLAQTENIVNIAGSMSHVGSNNTRSNLTHFEQRIEIVDYKVGFDYLETMNMRLKEGRFFNRNIQSDQTESVIVNETFVEKMGWDSPLNESFELDSVKRYVVGVVEDFHYSGFYSTLGPALFRIIPEENFTYLTLQVSPGHLNETEEKIKSAWSTIAPDDPYSGLIQNDVFAEFNNDNNANVKLLSVISALTVILASLGLFGLVSFNITRRMKEFSIRKVFGANIPHIFNLMNKDYSWILVIAFLVGAPLGFFMMNQLIQTIYPDPQTAGPLPFSIAVAVMTTTVAVTVVSQIRRIKRENPSQTLRND